MTISSLQSATRPSPPRWSAGVRAPAAMLVLFLALAVVHTWPLASAPGTWSRNDNDDTILHEWTLAWVAHQVIRDPVHLFDANIFYPERYTLAYSDHLFVQSMMVAPLLWAGGSPVLAYNLLLIAGFALTGWTTSLVVSRWTGSAVAGILSGSLIAFNALTLTRLPQIQDQHLEFFPLALFALDRVLVEPRLKHSLRLAGWFVLQALMCSYLLVFSSISLVVATIARPEPWATPRPRRLLGHLLLAAGLAVVALLPFLIPYLIVSRTVGLTRSLDEVAKYSAHLNVYLSTAGRLHYASWSHRFWTGDALFPGVVGLTLAGVAIGTGVAVRDRRARMTLAFGVAAVALSFGPAFPPYKWLYAVFSLMAGIRGAVRFGQFFLAMIAILAGYGLVALQQRMGPTRRALALGLALIVVANGEALRAPLGYFPYRGVPPAWDALAKAERGSIIVCFPFYEPRAIHANARYMLVSTHFWKPMLNGYSGFAPPSYYEHVAALASFPDQESINYLRKIGVTHVAVEGHLMAASKVARLDAFRELRLWATDGNLRIYFLR